MINLDDLKLFHLVATGKSIRSAAERLQVSRALIRRRLGGLEHALGQKLYTSSEKSFTLTAEGERLLHETPSLLSHAERVKQSLGHKQRKLLKIATPIGISTGFFFDLVMAFRALDSELGLDVIESEDPLAHLERGADLVLCEGDLPSYLDREIRQVAWAGKAYLMGHKDYLRQFDLGQGTEILKQMNVMCNNTKPIGNSLPLWNGGSIPVEPKLATSNESVISECVQTGFGVAMFPEVVLSTRPDWRTVLPEEVGYATSVSVISRPEAARSDEVRWFRTVLKSFLRDKFKAAGAGEDGLNGPESPA